MDLRSQVGPLARRIPSEISDGHEPGHSLSLDNGVREKPQRPSSSPRSTPGSNGHHLVGWRFDRRHRRVEQRGEPFHGGCGSKGHADHLGEPRGHNCGDDDGYHGQYHDDERHDRLGRVDEDHHVADDELVIDHRPGDDHDHGRPRGVEFARLGELGGVVTRVSGFARFRALGTTVVVGTADQERLSGAVVAVRAEIDACDQACSRFRPDSELSRLNDPGRTRMEQPASGWLCDALDASIYVAAQTGGLVDPTIGQCLVDLGYDRSFELLDTRPTCGVPRLARPRMAPDPVDRHRSAGVRPRPGCAWISGATAKALCADRAALAGSAVDRRAA